VNLYGKNSFDANGVKKFPLEEREETSLSEQGCCLMVVDLEKGRTDDKVSTF